MHKVTKYSNRKLYSTTLGKYITLDQLPEFGGVIVTCKQTGNDLTGSVLLEAAVSKIKKGNMELDGAILLGAYLEGNKTLKGDK